jgi:hypothetical protein
VSDDVDTQTYTVLFHLAQTNRVERFLPVLNSSIIRLVDHFSGELSLAETRKLGLCLSMFADAAYLFTNPQLVAKIGRGWGDQLLENAQYGRCSSPYAGLIPVMKNSNKKLHFTMPFLRLLNARI